MRPDEATPDDRRCYGGGSTGSHRGGGWRGNRPGRGLDPPQVTVDVQEDVTVVGNVAPIGPAPSPELARLAKVALRRSHVKH